MVMRRGTRIVLVMNIETVLWNNSWLTHANYYNKNDRPMDSHF